MPRLRDQANHPLQNFPHLYRLGDTDRQEVRFDQQNCAARPEARDEIASCRLGVGNVMKNGACSHEVETTRIDRPPDDVALTELDARSTHIIDKREVEIQRDDLSVGSNVLSHPRRH